MPRKSYSNRAIRSVNPKSLLKTNVEFILSATSRKERAASLKGKFVIEFMETNQTNGVNSSAAAYTDTLCALVAVKDPSGNVITHYPEALRTPLLAAADAGTNKLMAKMFFKALKQRNQVAFKEVFPEEQAVPVKKPVVEQVVVPETEVEEEEEESLESKMKRLQTEMETSSWDDDEEEEVVQDEEEPVVVQDEEVKVQDEVVADAPKKMKKKSRKSLEKWQRRRAAATLIQRVFRGSLARFVYKYELKVHQNMVKRDHERKVKFMKMRWKENWDLHMNDPMPGQEKHWDGDEEDKAWELEQDIDLYRWEQREFHD